MRAAIYLRVSTDGQTTDNQERELRAAAERIGHEIVAVYRDAGISGSKGRDQRPGFDAMHKDAARRRFDVVIAWSVDRLGRSLQDLCGFLSELHSLGIGLFLHQQGIDTTTPAGKANVPDDGRVRRVRALNDPAAGQVGHCPSQGRGQALRSALH
jgi:DNA invertase Pin-like site-specific DNA recombinase